MIFLKTVYTVLFAWLIFRVVRFTNEDRKTLFYSSTNILTSPCFSQARRMRKDSTSLSILRTVRNASALLQRSSLPLMLVLLANDVQLNHGGRKRHEIRQGSTNFLSLVLNITKLPHRMELDSNEMD